MSEPILKGKSSLSFAGLARDRMGIAMWQADGSGPEPAAVGHSFKTPLRKITAHYYIASRDFEGVDPSSLGGLRGAHPIVGFASLVAALAQHGFGLADLTIRLPLITPGKDIEGQDWFYRDDVETRFLRPSAPLMLQLRGENIVSLSTDKISLIENYAGATDFSQVRISAVSDNAQAIDVSAACTAVAQRIAQAFLVDVAGRTMRLVIDEIRVLAESFSGQGRVHGLFGEIPMSRIEATP